MSDHDLAALIGSRICHDLISPIGAIGNGVELLMMDGASTLGPELALISDSVAAASGRIRFFRLAFGAGGGGDWPLADLHTSLAGVGHNARWHWDITAPDPLPRAEARVLMLCQLCLESTFPTGAKVLASLGAGAGWLITATGARTRWEAGLWAHVASDIAGLASDATRGPILPAHVQFPLLGRALAELGRMGQVQMAEGVLHLRA